MKQLALFDRLPVGNHARQSATDPSARDKRKLVRVLKAAEKGGRVNGMSKAALKRYAPAKLPRVTIND